MDSLNELEKKSKTLDFSTDQWEQAMALVLEFGKEYLESLPEAKAWFALESPLSGRPTPLESPESLSQVLSDFSKLALNSGIEPTSGRFFGYIPGGGMPAAAIGDLLAALTNRYAGGAGASPGAVEIENQVVRWIRLLLDWPESSWGTLQSGGSMATLTAMIAARATRSFEQWSKSVIYLSQEAHHCFEKALLVVGLESSPIRKIAVDQKGQIDLILLKKQIREDRQNGFAPWILCATAGTTNLGAIDPLQECYELCRKEKIWFHVDAAYGGFFWLTKLGNGWIVNSKALF
jgi:glutamate/tyrosine decarboxylase-like PLP-dependent enzyme